jgi:hypothetical protein
VFAAKLVSGRSFVIGAMSRQALNVRRTCVALRVARCVEGDYGGEGDDDDPADADGAPKRPRLGEGGAVSASFGTGAYGGTPLGAGMTASTSLAPPTLGLPPGFVPRPPAGGMGLPPGFAPVALGLPPGFGGVGVTASAPPIASAAAVGQAFAAGVVPGMPVGEVLVYDNADYQMVSVRQ